MYLCLALGFEGRFRVQDNGRAQLDALRERLYRLLKGLAPPAKAKLSPRWAGTSGVRNPLLGWLPMWVVAILLGLLLVGLLLVGVYLALSYRLNRQSDPLYASIQALRAPATVAAAPPPPAAAPGRTAGARNPRRPYGGARSGRPRRPDPARGRPVRSGQR